MPNIKSAKKRVKQTIKRHVINLTRKSNIKTAVRKVHDAIEANDIDRAKELFKEAESKIARAKGKGLFHANTAARKVSRLAKRIAQAAK